MGSQFDELAKAVAQGASRRRVLRSLLPGLMGAVLATLAPSSRSEAVEVGAPGSSDPSLRQVSGPNRPSPSLNQSQSAANTGPRLNQAPVRLNQAPVQRNLAAQSRQTLPGQNRNQSVASAGHGQNSPFWSNSGHGGFNEQHPTWNQTTAAAVNQLRPGYNGGRPSINQIIARFSQVEPRLNQRGLPSWNQR
jgi:hypothetical protein